MSFKQLSDNLKPREKAMMYGPETLSDIELLALFLRSGTSDHDVLDLAKDLLIQYQSIKNICSSSLNELMSFKGIGKVKAIELLSFIELHKRMNNTPTNLHLSDLNLLVHTHIKNHSVENFIVVLLDQDDSLIAIKTLNIGIQDKVNIDPKDIISFSLKNGAKKLYCFHNHPSGDLSASKADQLVTRRIKHYADLFGLDLKGHYIINSEKKLSLIG